MALVSNSSLTLLFFFLTPSVSSDWFCALPSSRAWVGPQGSQQHDVHHHVLLVAPGLRLARRGRALLRRLLVRTCSIASRSAAFESRMSSGLFRSMMTIIKFDVWLWCLSHFLCSVVRSRLKRTPPMEMGLLKPRERDPESEDEILWGRRLETLTLNQGEDVMLYYRDESWQRRDTDTVSGHLTYLYLCLI